MINNDKNFVGERQGASSCCVGNKKYKLQIPSAFGVEGIVKRQLSLLGYNEARAVNGRVELSGDEVDVARLNMFIRSGERVLIKLTEFDAVTFDEVYDNVYGYDWSAILPKHARILVYGKSVKSTLVAVKPLCSVFKKAIVDKLKVRYGELDESGERYMLEIALFENHAQITLDASGEGLHKRGYRDLSVAAPLKETLAAALIDMTVYNPDKQFVDLFCGSGTIPIELALKETRTAVGLNREFDCAKWKSFDFAGAYAKAREEAEDVKRRDIKLNISGFDIDGNAISIARRHAHRAGMGDYVRFQAADMRSFSSKNRYGVMVCNPPYGERLDERRSAYELYTQLGELYRALPDWNFYVLTAHSEFEEAFGKRADKNRKLYNGNLECYYYTYLSAKPPKPPRV